MSVMYICIELDTNWIPAIRTSAMIWIVCCSELSMGRLDQTRTRSEPENNLKLQMSTKKPEQFCSYMEKGPISIFFKISFFSYFALFIHFLSYLKKSAS